MRAWLTLSLLFFCLSAAADEGIPKHSVAMNGREYSPDQQVILVLKAGKTFDESARRKEEFKQAKAQLAKLYPWRRQVLVETDTTQGFWRSYEETMSYLDDVAITQVLLLTDESPSIEANAGHPTIVYAIGDRKLRTSLNGSPIMPEDMFSEIRSKMADQAQALVIQGTDTSMLNRAAHQFYARLLGVRDGEVVLAQPVFNQGAFAVLNLGINSMALTSVTALSYALTQPPFDGGAATAILSWVISFGIVHEFLGDATAERWLPGALSMSRIKNGGVINAARTSTQWLRKWIGDFAKEACPIALTGNLK